MAARFLAALIGLWVFASGSAIAELSAASACPSERAVYTHEFEDGTLEMGFWPARNFASMASDLYLYLTTPARTYWFTFSVSQGYSGMTLLPVSDPRAEEARESGPRDLLARYADEDPELQDVLVSLRFYALDEDFTFLFEPPVIGELAPPYIMAPEIGLTLWYSPGALTEEEGAERDSIPRALLQLTDCLPEDRAPAYP
ncbi:hypothetical protein EMQ25_02420 [Arsenicitalea aurantiaca]|uniref:DUF1254 domain-containing protein n=1 Tax=Arsenicitalea aurantiaca TaxID=1783274 RepID=A0A433XLD4_9HYPH|nr:hypothetical protein [Arsenicitalea aurantiaca]RUT34834.1 hypothetical protein EMQ25_02420 [Arsenicitalea aurantiaca]